MLRKLVPFSILAALLSAGCAAAQQPASADPQMPAMPSMEGQQGDVSKPVTQIPSRKKAVGTVRGTTAKRTTARRGHIAGRHKSTRAAHAARSGGHRRKGRAAHRRRR